MDLIAHAMTGALLGRALTPPAATPATHAAMNVFGAIAGVAPDLDALVEIRGKLAGWRYHRVALHGIPTAMLLALVLVGIARSTDAVEAGIVRLAATAFLAVASHLVLDVLTSFGTALLFPFSRARYSTRSHFIADPVVLGVLAIGLFSGASLAALAALGVYLIASIAVRTALLRIVARNLERAGLPSGPLTLEPRLLAPWRWLAVVTESDGYLVATVTPLGTSRWRRTSSGRAHDAALVARRNPLLSAFLDTCDFPRFEWSGSTTGRTLVVEDVKWWIELPFRPLAFSARVGTDAVPRAPRQTRMFERGPRGTFEAAPLEEV